MLALLVDQTSVVCPRRLTSIPNHRILLIASMAACQTIEVRHQSHFDRLIVRFRQLISQVLKVCRKLYCLEQIYFYLFYAFFKVYARFHFLDDDRK